MTTQTNAEPSVGLIRSQLRKTLPFGFLARPTIMSVLAVAGWNFFFLRTGFRVSQEDVVFAIAFLAFFGTWHAVYAGFIVFQVWNDYTRVMECVTDGNRRRFDRVMRNRIPKVIRVSLLIISVFIQLLVFLLPYSKEWFGYTGCALMGFVLVMFWEVAYYLDNPIKAPWYRELVPAGWWVADTEKPPTA